jgi:hypothetical protein
MTKGFVEGLGFAIAWMSKWHDAGTMIEELYETAGFALKEYEKVCEEYDLVEIRKVAESVKRKIEWRNRHEH